MFFCSFLAILGLLFALFCLKVCARSSKLERPSINSKINLIDRILQYHISIFTGKIRKVLLTLQIYFLKPRVLCFDLRINTSMIKEQGTYNGPDEFLISGAVVN